MLKSLLKKIKNYYIILYEIYIKKNKVSFNSTLRNVYMGKKTSIGCNSIINNSQIDDLTYVGNNCYIANAKIGKYCSIGSYVNFALGRHPIQEFLSSHPYFYSKKVNPILKTDKFIEYKYISDNYMVEIGNDVWIGNNVTILDGVIIGNGAIIGAGSVVTKNIPDFAVVCGVPAKVIKYRFDEKTIKKINNLKWWEKDQKWIDDNVDYFEKLKILEKKD